MFELWKIALWLNCIHLADHGGGTGRKENAAVPSIGTDGSGCPDEKPAVSLFPPTFVSKLTLAVKLN